MRGFWERSLGIGATTAIVADVAADRLHWSLWVALPGIVIVLVGLLAALRPWAGQRHDDAGKHG